MKGHGYYERETRAGWGGVRGEGGVVDDQGVFQAFPRGCAGGPGLLSRQRIPIGSIPPSWIKDSGWAFGGPRAHPWWPHRRDNG